jgi:hypothetical protein
MLITPAPKIPGVATHDFLGRKIDAAFIGLKMSTVICGKSAVDRPAAFASSIGSFFLQLVRARTAHAPRQLPTRARRRTSPLAGSNAFTEPLVIRFSSTLWQENSRVSRQRSRRAQRSRSTRIAHREHQTLFSFSGASSNFANQSGTSALRCVFKMSRTKQRKSPRQSAQSFSRVCAPSMR